MINILVIEDDVSIREIINYNLSNKFSVLTADNAEEGLEICQEEKIDLILLDWMLPGMSGLSFLRTIKKKALPLLYQLFSLQQNMRKKISWLALLQEQMIIYLNLFLIKSLWQELKLL